MSQRAARDEIARNRRRLPEAEPDGGSVHIEDVALDPRNPVLLQINQKQTKASIRPAIRDNGARISGPLDQKPLAMDVPSSTMIG
jgi:hypothetical protein